MRPKFVKALKVKNLLLFCFCFIYTSQLKRNHFTKCTEFRSVDLWTGGRTKEQLKGSSSSLTAAFWLFLIRSFNKAFSLIEIFLKCRLQCRKISLGLGQKTKQFLWHRSRKIFPKAMYYMSIQYP